jgi:hypothetical protein
LDWVDAGGAKGWEVASGERYADEKDDDDGEGRGIVGLSVEKERGDESGDEDGTSGTYGYADSGKIESAKEDAALDDAGTSAQGHANADFLGLARDGVGDYAVDAEGGEDEAERGEDGY